MKLASVNVGWIVSDSMQCNNNNVGMDDKCPRECKELINKGERGYACNPNNCECECDKSCDAVEYLDYENWKRRKRLVDKFVEECNENVDEAKLTEIALFEHKNERVCHYTVCSVLGVIALTICIGVSTYFFYYKYINRNKENVSAYDYVYQTKKILII